MKVYQDEKDCKDERRDTRMKKIVKTLALYKDEKDCKDEKEFKRC